MSVRLTIISNTSNQIIPIVVERIRRELASGLSDVVPYFSGTIRVNPGSQLKVEVSRIDLGQIEKLANLNLITSTHRAIEEPSRDTSGIPDPEAITWIRPTEWLEMPDISGVEGFAGLFAIYEAGNFLAITASGAYTVDWGDGTTTNHVTGTTAYKIYDYFSTPDTGESSLGYRHVIVQVYPQVGNHLTSLNIGAQHNQSGLNASHTIPWLDIAVNGPNLTSFPIGNAEQANSRLRVLERCVIYDIALTSMSNLFSYCDSLKDFIILESSNITDTSYMFRGCINLKSIRLFDTSNVTNMEHMFDRCELLTTIPQFNTANVTNMSYMFHTCDGLKTIPLLNTANVTDMSYMFQFCQVLESLPLLNTSNVTNMRAMFYSCPVLKTIPHFNTSNVTDMSEMFQNCFVISTIPHFNTTNVTDMNNMFNRCAALIEVPPLNTGNVTNMHNMFYSCQRLQKVDLLDTAKVTDMSYMFFVCFALETISQFNTSNVTDMRSMFYYCMNLKSIPHLDTSNVTDMTGMFYRCTELIEVPHFNTSKVTNMNAMLQFCYSLRSVPQFDTSEVTNMNGMLSSCYNLREVPEFNTSKVTNMGGMFINCYSLPSIPLLNGRSVTNFGVTVNSIFSNCISLIKGAIYRARSSIDYSNCKLSGAELDNIYTNLAGLGTRSISGATGNGTEVTYTTTTAHPYQVGQLITVTGLSPSGFNVSNVVVTAVPSNVQFRVTNTTTGSSTGTGTANGGSSATITVTGNYGIATHNPSIATSKGWTVATS